MKPSTHARLHRLLVPLYPAAFREEYGAQMSADFEDRIADARSKGLARVASVWWAEMSQLPESLATTYEGGIARTRLGTRLPAALVIAASLAVAFIASHLVAHTGLYHRSSQLALLFGLLLCGLLLGLASLTRTAPRVALPAAVLIASILTLPWLVDRHLLLNHTSEAISADLPGVHLDASRFSSPTDAKTFVTGMTSSPSARVRSETLARRGSVVVTVLRSGGVDWAYALLSLLLVLASGALVRSRAARSSPLFS